MLLPPPTTPLQFLRGVYSVYLEVWLQFFDRKDFLILRSEDYYADPGGVYKQVGPQSAPPTC